MSAPDPALRLDGPGEFVETLPYVLGFRPEASVVLVGLDGTRLVVAARIDLADASAAEPIAASVAVLRRADADAAIVVVYAADGDQPMFGASARTRLPHGEIVDRIARAGRARGLSVLESLFVQAGRWWSYPGRAAGCAGCGSGERLPGDAAVGPAAAVFAGLQAQPSRAALEAMLDPQPPATRELLRVDIEASEDALRRAAIEGRLPRAQRALARAVIAAARAGDRAASPSSNAGLLPASMVGRFAVGLREIAVRDVIWLAIDQQRLDGRALWLQLLRRLPAPHDSAPLFLFGWASWRDGNGTLAAMAARRARASDPGYTAAGLLLSAVQNGLDPFRTPRLAPGEQP